jgi:hypothetical protein
MATKQDILNFIDREVNTVNAFGSEIKIKSMSVTQLFRFQTLLAESQASKDYSKCQLYVCRECCVGDDGKPLFGDCDLQALGEKSFKEINKIFQGVLKMNAFSDETNDELKKS